MKLVRKPWIWVSRFRNRKGYGVHSPFAYSFIRGVVLETTPYYAYSELARLHPWWVRWGRMYPLSCRQLLFRLANFAEPKTVVLLTEDEVAKKYVRAAVPRAEIISAGKPLSTNTGRGKGDTKRERMEREERERMEKEEREREMEKREGGKEMEKERGKEMEKEREKEMGKEREKEMGKEGGKEMGKEREKEMRKEREKEMRKEMERERKIVERKMVEMKAEFVFIGREHLREAARYAVAMPPQGMMVCEGIHGNRKAMEIWRAIQADPHTGITFDLYTYGVAFFNHALYKQHYKVNF